MDDTKKSISVSDGEKDEVLKDISVNNQGIVEETSDEDTVKNVETAMPPEVVGEDGTPPPHDEVIHEPQQTADTETEENSGLEDSSAEETATDNKSDDESLNDQSDESASNKPEHSDANDLSSIKEAPSEDETVTPEDQKPQVILPAGADPDLPQTHDGEKHRSSNKAALIGIVLVLTIVLVAVVLLVFVKTNKSTKNTATNSDTNATAQESTQSTQQAAPVTENDVDTTIQDVDDTMSALDDTKDFGTDDISDSALGL